MSRRRSISRFAVVAAFIAAVALVGAGSASAESVTTTTSPSLPNGSNGWYVTPPSIQFDWVIENHSAGGTGSGYNERLVQVNCGNYANFLYLGGNFSGAAGPPPFSPTLDHEILTMFVMDVDPASPVIEPSCRGTYERVFTICVFGACSVNGFFLPIAPVESAALALKVDLWDPTIAADTAAPPNGLNGWYRSNVTVAFDCADQGSGLATLACPSDQILSQEGAGVSSTALTVTDMAGRVSDPSNTVTVKIDKTAPDATCGTTPTFVRGSSGNTVSATVTDGISQPLAASVSAAAPTTALGHQSADVTGSDKAGNTRTVSCPYIVGFGFTGFSAPVDADALNIAKAGQAVPLKFHVSDASGAVTNLTGYTLTSNGEGCDDSEPTDAIEAYAAGASGLQNLGGGNYQINWKTDKAFAGQCRQVNLTVGGDTTVHSADFKFVK